MADPLAQMAEREVPAPTNYFDPAAAQTVISRYSNSRRLADSSGAALDRVSRVQSDALRYQDDQTQSAQRNTLFNQHEEDYKSQKEAMATRGDFLRSLADKANLDPDSPDYPAQKAKLLSTMHEGLGKDDAVRDTLASMDQQHEAGQRTRAAEDARKQALEDRKAYLHEKVTTDPRIVGVLTPEEYQQHVDPISGEVDSIGVSQHAYQKSQAQKMDNSKELINERARVSSESQAKKSAEIDRRKVALKSGVADQEAFPNQEAAFLLAHPGFDPTMVGSDPKKVAQRANYLAAKEYEKNKLDSEIASALNYDTPEGYVNLAGKTEAAKKKRRALWDLAHEMQGNAAPTGSDVPVANGVDRAPPTTAGKPLDRDTGMKFLKEAGNDPAKARELARAAGFTF